MENKLIIQSKSITSEYGSTKIACLCHKGSWGAIIKQQCFRAGFEAVTLLYDGLSDEKLNSHFDIIFIDENIDEERTGSEVIDSLITRKVINPTTGIIMVCRDITSIIPNYDIPLMLTDFISLPFSEKQLISKLRKMALSVQLFKPTLTFISSGRISFALKSLSAIPKDKITKNVVNDLLNLSVNLNFELGNYGQVVQICNKPNVKSLPWSLWPNFKANYELGNWEYCKQSLLEDEFTSLPNGAVKFFWQLRILLQQQSFDDALTLIDEYPNNEMPTTMVRLVYIILIFAQKSQEAQEFIERKIRLAKPNSALYGQLMMTQCNLYLYKYMSPEKNDKEKLLSDLYLLLAEFDQTFVAKKFILEVSIINTYIELIKMKEENNTNKLELIFDIKQKIQSISDANSSPIIACRIAYAWYVVGEQEKAFDTLVKVDCGFSYLPLGSERLILGIVQTQIFNGIFQADEAKFEAYTKLGNIHANKKRFKLACKAFARALDIKHDKQVRNSLAKSMIEAGITQFSGFKANMR